PTAGGGGGRRPGHRRAGGPAPRPPAGHGLQQPGPARQPGLPRRRGSVLARAVAFVQAHELAGYAQHLLGYRARVRLDQGDWAGAEQDARAALAEPGEGGGRAVEALEALVTLALLQARRGHPGAADTLQEATERAFSTGELQFLRPGAAAPGGDALLD